MVAPTRASDQYLYKKSMALERRNLDLEERLQKLFSLHHPLIKHPGFCACCAVLPCPTLQIVRGIEVDV